MMTQYLNLNSPAIEDLKRPFAAKYHDFIRGFVYLAERAVCERIEQVDPAWSFIINEMIQRGEQVVVTATMTILGTSRQGVGMSEIRMIGKSPNEAEKGAATDALRRCARLFGVGRYLLDVPKHVKDDTSLSKWLHSISGDNQPPPPPAKQQHTPKRSAPANQPTQPEPEQAVESGATKNVTIIKRETKKAKNGKPMLVFTTTSNDVLFVFSRQPFKDKGYCDDADWITVGESEDMKITVTIKQNDNGYWDIVPDSIPPFDPGFDDLGQSTLPGTPDENQPGYYDGNNDDGDVPF